jgi:heme-degrading monooxygenase HmoA
MYMAQFIFRPGNYDADFHKLDEAIDAYALTLPGFKGVERWVSPDGATKNSNYFFEDTETIKTFSRFPDHLDAKKNYSKWYLGYQVVISQVVASYGDGTIESLAKV